MTLKKLRIFAGVSIALIANLAAHPGPPGHTHGDEWPFAVLPTLAVLAVLLYFLKVSPKRD